MTLASPQLRGLFEDYQRPVLVNGRITRHRGLQKETSIGSEDGDLSEDECNLFKAARIEEPAQCTWESVSPQQRAAPTPKAVEQCWTPEDSDALYNVSGWSEGYFKIDSDGFLCVRPTGGNGASAALDSIVDSLLAHTCLRTPIILRFPDIIGHRIAQLTTAFSDAIQQCTYKGAYRGVFPVKCNHDRDVLHAVLEFGRQWGFGLEVGSKAELILAMSVIAESDLLYRDFNGTDCSFAAHLLVCNGYKDAEYMELAVRCSQLGVQAIIVMEQPQEVELAIAAASVATTTTAPPLQFGIRAKLATAHAGHWGTTSGDRAKFGLSAREIVTAVRRLAVAGQLSSLTMLHFHVGSQMSTLGAVRDAMVEGANLYVELIKMGATEIDYLDVGGGLAIDYDGSATEAHTSRAYTLTEYAVAVVGTIGHVCTSRGVSAPSLVSESGRALASHHAVVIFDVLGGAPAMPYSPTDCCPREGKRTDTSISTPDDAIVQPHFQPKTQSIDAAGSPSLYSPLGRISLEGEGTPPEVPLTGEGESSRMLRLLQHALDSMDGTSGDVYTAQEAMNTAAMVKRDSLRAFKEGILTLDDRVAVDEVFDQVCHRAHVLGAASTSPPVTILHINLSVFRSAVDSWAIRQVFPIVPLSRLNERPELRAVLADLTCDSDGKIDVFPNPKGGEPLNSLPVHAGACKEGRPGRHRPYRLALFLAGVYQEALGSSHNMFGALNTATVRLRRDMNVRMAPSCVSLRGIHESPSENSVATWHACACACGESNGHVECSSCFLPPLMQGFGRDDAAHSGEKVQGIRHPPFRLKMEVRADGNSPNALSFVVETVVNGESMADVVSRAGHDPGRILDSICGMAARVAMSGCLDAEQRQRVTECFALHLHGYTYMKS